MSYIELFPSTNTPPIALDLVTFIRTPFIIPTTLYRNLTTTNIFDIESLPITNTPPIALPLTPFIGTIFVTFPA
jgi:hypothetical protein